MKKVMVFFLMATFSVPLFAQIDVDQWEKNLVKISDKIYAAKFETSYADYTPFIQNLQTQNEEAKLQQAQIDHTKWTTLLNSEPMSAHYHTLESYKNFPVVNVTPESASLYCRWLTKQYNNSANRKFNKVIFRLPTVNEWETAAKGGNINATYPWKGNSLKNNKGEIVANFKNPSNENNQTIDLTAPVQSYFPNAFGIYNMSGNVSEMVIDSPVTKGGSWNDSPEFLTITSQQKFDKVPSPTIGFRVFMEVIEK